MSGAHRGTRSPGRRGSLRRACSSVRLRAALSLGVLVLPLGMGTLAFWTDQVTVSGATFTGGKLNMTVNNSDNAYASATLAMPLMVPGATSAEVLTVKNVGNVALKYSLTGGLTGTDAAAMAPSLKLTIRASGTKTGTTTCTTGTLVYDSALTTTTTTQLITTAAPRGPVVATTGADALCFQITFASGAPTGLQGKTATAELKFLGTTYAS